MSAPENQNTQGQSAAASTAQTQSAHNQNNVANSAPSTVSNDVQPQLGMGNQAIDSLFRPITEDTFTFDTDMEDAPALSDANALPQTNDHINAQSTAPVQTQNTTKFELILPSQPQHIAVPPVAPTAPAHAPADARRSAGPPKEVRRNRKCFREADARARMAMLHSIMKGGVNDERKDAMRHQLEHFLGIKRRFIEKHATPDCNIPMMLDQLRMMLTRDMDKIHCSERKEMICNSALARDVKRKDHIDVEQLLAAAPLTEEEKLLQKVVFPRLSYADGRNPDVLTQLHCRMEAFAVYYPGPEAWAAEHRRMEQLFEAGPGPQNLAVWSASVPQPQPQQQPHLQSQVYPQMPQVMGQPHMPRQMAQVPGQQHHQSGLHQQTPAQFPLQTPQPPSFNHAQYLVQRQQTAQPSSLPHGQQMPPQFTQDSFQPAVAQTQGMPQGHRQSQQGQHGQHGQTAFAPSAGRPMSRSNIQHPRPQHAQPHGLLRRSSSQSQSQLQQHHHQVSPGSNGQQQTPVPANVGRRPRSNAVHERPEGLQSLVQNHGHSRQQQHAPQQSSQQQHAPQQSAPQYYTNNEQELDPTQPRPGEDYLPNPGYATPRAPDGTLLNPLLPVPMDTSDAPLPTAETEQQQPEQTGEASGSSESTLSEEGHEEQKETELMRVLGAAIKRMRSEKEQQQQQQQQQQAQQQQAQQHQSQQQQDQQSSFSRTPSSETLGNSSSSQTHPDQTPGPSSQEQQPPRPKRGRPPGSKDKKPRKRKCDQGLAAGGCSIQAAQAQRQQQPTQQGQSSQQFPQQQQQGRQEQLQSQQRARQQFQAYRQQHAQLQAQQPQQPQTQPLPQPQLALPQQPQQPQLVLPQQSLPQPQLALPQQPLPPAPEPPVAMPQRGPALPPGLIRDSAMPTMGPTSPLPTPIPAPPSVWTQSHNAQATVVDQPETPDQNAQGDEALENMLGGYAFEEFMNEQALIEDGIMEGPDDEASQQQGAPQQGELQQAQLQQQQTQEDRAQQVVEEVLFAYYAQLPEPEQEQQAQEPQRQQQQPEQAQQLEHQQQVPSQEQSSPLLPPTYEDLLAAADQTGDGQQEPVDESSDNEPDDELDDSMPTNPFQRMMDDEWMGLGWEDVDNEEFWKK